MNDHSEKFSLLNAASYANGYNPLIGWSKGIGYRPNSLRYADRSHFTNCGEEFLINSYTTRCDIEDQGSVQNYLSDSGLTMLSMMENRDYGLSRKIELPDSIPLNLSLGESILRRRSVRSYTGDEITLQHLASILRAAYGVSSQAMIRSESGNSIPLSLRTVSSGGGLYPITLLVVALRVNKLARGIYEYSPTEDSLVQLEDGNLIQKIINSYAVSDDFISFSRANYLCLFVGNIWKSMRKYGNKGLRFVLQEIGSISQNIHLSNVSLGLSSTDCAAYYENEINELLKLDGINQSVLHTIISGIDG